MADRMIHVQHTNFHDNKAFTSVATPLKGMRLLHIRMAHFSEDKIKDSIRQGAKLASPDIMERALRSTEKSHACTGCLKGKSKAPVKHRQANRPRLAGEVVHCDIKTDLPTSHNGAKHFIHFTCDKTRSTWTYSIKKKSDAVAAFLLFLAEANSAQHQVRTIRCDNDSVLIEGNMKGVLAEKNIKITTTAPHDKQAGGRHERIIDTLWTHVMAIHHSNPDIPLKYWPLTLKFVTLIYNALVHSATGKIPFTEWTGQTADVSYLRAFGSQVYAYVPKQLRKSTQPRSESYVYLGHKNKTTLYAYDPAKDKVYEKGHFVRSVEFFNDDNTTANIKNAPQRIYESVVEGGDDDTNSAGGGGTQPAANTKSAGGGGIKRTASTISEGGETTPGRKSKKGKETFSATAGTTAMGNRAISTEQYMTNDEEWLEIELNYGPHNLEACARDDGKNARLKRGLPSTYTQYLYYT